jgi:hypothetical protein
MLRTFLAALDGSAPELRTANMNDLSLLCEKFGFAGLLSPVSEFRLQHAVVDDESRKGVYRIEKEIRQQNRALGLQQKEISDLRAVHSHLSAESASLGQTNKTFEQLLCLLQMEAVDLR